MTRLELLVPGLLGPLPIHPDDVPRLPVLERLLARADRLPGGSADPVESVLGRFGIAPAAGGYPPSAPLCRLADAAGAQADGCWLHADPVHLRPDRDRLVLFDSRRLEIDAEEAAALVGLFNGHFAGEGLHLEAPVPGRWYLRVAEPPRLCTRPLHAVVGRNVDPFLPRGEDARRWAALLTEAQMLFHQAECNRRRERAGRPAVNGLWIWGGGWMPEIPAGRGYGALLGEGVLLRGLGMAAGVPVRPVPEDPAGLPETGGGRILVQREDLRQAVQDADATGWVAGLRRLDAWLGALVPRLGAGRIGDIEIDPGTGERLRVTRGGVRRFWRRPRPFSCFLATPG